MSWLSPVQWAKWTWSAVTGGAGDEGQPTAKDDNSDSEVNFATPEEESPGFAKRLNNLDNSGSTVRPSVTNCFLDTNSNQDVGSISPQKVDSLNNVAGSTFNYNSLGLDQNLNVTLSSRAAPEGGLSASNPLPQHQALRPPSLSVRSPLNKPDPTEVDDEAPTTSDSSPDSNLLPGCGIYADSDLLNGNVNSDPALSDAQLACNHVGGEDSARQSSSKTDGTIIKNFCKAKQQHLAQKDDDHHGGHATDEEKLASSKPDKDQSNPECNRTSSQEESDCCSAYEDMCTLKNESGGSEVPKTGSQVLDSICITEAEKQAVLTLIKEEIITKETEAGDWKRKYEDSRQEVMEMRKIVAEYEKTIAQMIEDEQRNNMSSQKALHATTVEKESAMADLNSVERSLSDLFRRYENLKSTVEGFKKNEEVLKKCAQDYLARIKQEEQRYQTLKVHAEEKLDKANEEIAQVRSKTSSEKVALSASLRMEQSKGESLEQALQQKNQEIEELTKICDELIGNMSKI
ncbi:transforming acidic coiled-coil-containing protein 1-like isoform X2 [Genypterus blacodes]|uniref:transforming acidic coiled-coil-containing protein 1-like isoform X2 n=1 Tax=Genypterus blacodes TaxID=154954 RepID=UPI003F762744